MRWIGMFSSVISACVVLMLAASAKPATACSSIAVEMFTRFDNAAVVAVGRSGSQRTALLVVTVETVLKGTDVATLTFDVRRPCGRILQRNREVVVFADGHGRVIDFAPRDAAIISALERWSALAGGTNQARLDLLSELAKSKHRALGRAARERREIELRRLRKADHQRR